MLQSVPLMTKVLLAWVAVETVLITAYTGVVLATGARQQFVCVLLVSWYLTIDHFIKHVSKDVNRWLMPGST